MLELNPDQKRNFLTTLEHVNKLLSECEHVLNDARSPSLLQEYVFDITPEQQERILEYIAQFRIEVKALLQQQGIMPTQAHKSSLDTILTYLLFADMALEEIDSKNMDHGKLSKESAQKLDVIVSQMRRFLGDMRVHLNRAEKNRTV